MMDCEGKVSFSPVAEGWFSEELPSPGCCSSTEVASGMVADVKLGFCGRRSEIGGGGRKVRAEKVSVGILRIVNWRYVLRKYGRWSKVSAAFSCSFCCVKHLD